MSNYPEPIWNAKKMSNYPEPIWNAKNMNRKQGDTTFELCGWCEFASCGTCRYSCHLDTNCGLMGEYDNNREVKWDTKCIIKKLGLEDIKQFIESKKYAIKDSYECIRDLRKEIHVLSHDKRIPRKKKPILPDHRDVDYFKIKNVVWVFYQDKWNRGVVVSGYRTYDGCVSYVLDNYPNSAEGWGCGCAVPCILADWEYKYFRKHHQEYKEYLKLCNRKYNSEKLPLDKYDIAMSNKEGKCNI